MCVNSMKMVTLLFFFFFFFFFFLAHCDIIKLTIAQNRILGFIKDDFEFNSLE